MWSKSSHEEQSTAISEDIMNSYRNSDRRLCAIGILLLVAALAPRGVTANDKKGASSSSKPSAPASKPASSGGASHGGTPSNSAGRSAGQAGRPAGQGTPGHVSTPGAGGGPGRPAAGGVGRPSAPAGARQGLPQPPAAGRGPSTGGARAGVMGGHPVPNGSRTVQSRNGSEVRMRPGGRVADMHMANRGMDIHHGLNGNRQVVVNRADRSLVFAERGTRGYVQRPYNYRGHEFSHRTYYDHGRAYDRLYRSHYYHGVFVDVYAPAYYYRPAFYGWAYNPWPAPMAFSWGWRGDPWYGYYGYYFTPYPTYPSASFWLTDYMVSNTLAAAYQAGQENAASQMVAQRPAEAFALTPELKGQIAAEVQRQIAIENAEAQGTAQNADFDPASSGVQRMLTDQATHTLVAGRQLDVVDSTGLECTIGPGDVIQFAGPVPPGSSMATVTIRSSKGGSECRANLQVSVSIADLQDMQNHMRESIGQGLGELQAKQGTGGFPRVPATVNIATVRADYSQGIAGPEPDAAAQIQQQWQEADRAEEDTLSQLPADAGMAPLKQTAAPAASAVVGQSVEEVSATMGMPPRIVDLGAQKIYLYTNQKVTFTDGKVTSVQ